MKQIHKYLMYGFSKKSISAIVPNNYMAIWHSPFFINYYSKAEQKVPTGHSGLWMLLILRNIG